MIQKVFLSVVLILTTVLFTALTGCTNKDATPRNTLDKYFMSAIRQDYAETYNCYYAAYKAKVDKSDFIKHRKEASVLQGYRIVALNLEGNLAHADTLLTFAPSEKLKRTEPVEVRVKEELINEGGEWKIKVW